MKTFLLTVGCLLLFLLLPFEIVRAEVHVPGSNVGDRHTDTPASQEAISNFTVQVDISHFPYSYDWNEIVEVYCTKDGMFYGDYDLSPVNDYKYSLFLMPGNYKFLCRVRYDRLGIYHLENAEYEYSINDSNIRNPHLYTIVAYENEEVLMSGEGAGLRDASDLESAYSDIEQWEREHNLEVREKQRDGAAEPLGTFEGANMSEAKVSPSENRDEGGRQGAVVYGYVIILMVFIIFLSYLMYLVGIYERSKDE